MCIRSVFKKKLDSLEPMLRSPLVNHLIAFVALTFIYRLHLGKEQNVESKMGRRIPVYVGRSSIEGPNPY